MTYIVTAPLVVIANSDRVSGDLYAYAGAVVPDGWNDARCEQLVVDGMLLPVEPVLDPLDEVVVVDEPVVVIDPVVPASEETVVPPAEPTPATSPSSSRKRGGSGS